MIDINLSDILKVVDGNLIGQISSKDIITIKRISTDSRDIKESDLFVPLIGLNFNGHDFIESIFKNGAIATLVQNGQKYKLIPNKIYIEVKNVLHAYQNISTYIRQKINPNVIAITGSSGKTSTKEITASFLEKFYTLVKTKGNFNNEIGLPKTLLDLNEKSDVCVVEMGMRGLGQIDELCNIANPDIGIITNIGTAHIELLKTKNNIASAKWELADYLIKRNGVVIIPKDDIFLYSLSKKSSKPNFLYTSLKEDSEATLYLEKEWVENDKQFFMFHDNTTNKSHKVLISLLGKHQVSNALLSIAIAKPLSIDYPDFIDLSFESLFGRNELIEIGKTKFINDAYNANPESMKAAVETFYKSYKNKSKTIVLGEMKELGDDSYQYHYDVGKFIANFNFEQIVLIGENSIGIKNGISENSDSKLYFFLTNKDASIHLERNKTDYIFLKASRGAKLEEILDYFK